MSEEPVITSKGGENIGRRVKMTFASNIKKFGNSYHIICDKKSVEKMQLKDGDDIDVTIALPLTVDDEEPGEE